MKARKPTFRHGPEEIDTWFEWNIDKKRRTIYVGAVNFDSDGNETGVDTLMAEYVIKGIHVLNDSKSPITLILNSTGGDYYHGMAIFDAIRNSVAPVDIIGTGNVMSMGAVILQAGRKRMLTPYATLMIHHGYSDIGNLRHTDAQRWAKHEQRISGLVSQIFAERTGKTKDYWMKRAETDSIYTSEEALDAGLIDKIQGKCPT